MKYIFNVSKYFKLIPDVSKYFKKSQMNNSKYLQIFHGTFWEVFLTTLWMNNI
jgi:hypothetical protein